MTSKKTSVAITATNIATATVTTNANANANANTNANKLSLLQRKAEAITADEFTLTMKNRILQQSEENALTICNYLIAMKTEVNPVKHYKQITIQTLCYLSEFHHQE